MNVDAVRGQAGDDGSRERQGWGERRVGVDGEVGPVVLVLEVVEDLLGEMEVDGVTRGWEGGRAGGDVVVQS